MYYVVRVYLVPSGTRKTPPGKDCHRVEWPQQQELIKIDTYVALVPSCRITSLTGLVEDGGKPRSEFPLFY